MAPSIHIQPINNVFLFNLPLYIFYALKNFAKVQNTLAKISNFRTNEIPKFKFRQPLMPDSRIFFFEPTNRDVWEAAKKIFL